MRKILFYFLSVCLLYPVSKVAGQVVTHITQGIYKNMVHIATNMLSIQRLSLIKQHLIKGILEQIKMKHWWNWYKATKNPDENPDLPMDFHSLWFPSQRALSKISMIFAKNRQIQTSQYLREIFINVLIFGENFVCLLFAIIIIIPYCSAY
jgi:hypothetical protein